MTCLLFEPGISLATLSWWLTTSAVAGYVFAQASGRELTIFCNEWLEKVTAGKFRACRHRVATQPNTPRLSMLYELRLHRERWVDTLCKRLAGREGGEEAQPEPDAAPR